MNTSKEVSYVEQEKKVYKRLEIEIIDCGNEDIITASGDAQLPYRPVKSSFNIY